jgi:hypothetical protein
MQQVCSTDYLAIIFAVARAHHLSPSQQSVTEPSVKLTNPVIPRLISDEMFHQRMAADFSLVPLAVNTAIMVVCVIVNVSR